MASPARLVLIPALVGIRAAVRAACMAVVATGPAVLVPELEVVQVVPVLVLADRFRELAAVLVVQVPVLAQAVKVPVLVPADQIWEPAAVPAVQVPVLAPVQVRELATVQVVPAVVPVVQVWELAAVKVQELAAV